MSSPTDRTVSRLTIRFRRNDRNNLETIPLASLVRAIVFEGDEIGTEWLSLSLQKIILRDRLRYLVGHPSTQNTEILFS